MGFDVEVPAGVFRTNAHPPGDDQGGIERSGKSGAVAPDPCDRQSSSRRSFQFHHFNSSCCGSGVRAA
jgi:hypothetical protein